MSAVGPTRWLSFTGALTTSGDVHVDLRELHFADASLVLDFMMVARRVRQVNHDHIPPQVVRQPSEAQLVPFTLVTKVRRIPGSAARKASKVAGSLGYSVAEHPESFYVEDVDGPLAPGELERARAWGDRIGTHLEVVAN